MNSLNKAKEFFKKNSRYIIATLILLLVFLINRGLFIKETITTEDCSKGNCPTTVVEEPSLSDKSAFFYIDDLMQNKEKGYYRLTFKARSNENSSMILKLVDFAENEASIKKYSLTKNSKYSYEEFNLYYDGNFPLILFEKENFNDNSKIYIKEVGISKLNITNEAEFKNLKPTIIGETDFDAIDQKQIDDSSYKLPWLKEENTSIGQIFKADSEYISGISFKLDITKSIDPGSRKYILSLQKVSYDGNSIKKASDSLTSLNFSVASSIEKYRQGNGSFLFPIFAHLEKGSYYWVSISNSNVNVNDFDFLTFRGSKNENSYPDGSAAMKKGKEIYTIDGDLYFIVHSASFRSEGSERILSGAKIEDLGKGLGSYSYQTKGTSSDALDLDPSSSDVNFDGERKILRANVKEENSLIYKFSTIYPIIQFYFKGQQIKSNWNKIKVFYSLDKENWIALPFIEENDNFLTSPDVSDNSNQPASKASDEETPVPNDESQNNENISTKSVQTFDFVEKMKQKTSNVYIKITYDPESPIKSKYFGIKNLSFSADLNIK